MATSIQQEILAVLGASRVPLKALEIASKIGRHRIKKDVNQVIYTMKQVERVNPGQNPPLWKNIQPSPVSPAVASPTRGHSTSIVPPSPDMVPLSPTKSASLYHHTKQEDGILSFTPVTLKGVAGSMPCSSLSTTPIQQSEGILRPSSNECPAHESANQLDDCTITCVRESGSDQFTAACQDGDIPQRKGGNKQEGNMLASFNLVALEDETHKSKLMAADVDDETKERHLWAQEVDRPALERSLAASEVDHLLQQQQLVDVDVDHVTEEVDHLVDDISSLKVD